MSINFAAPESGTPETDALRIEIDCLPKFGERGYNSDKYAALVFSRFAELERRLSESYSRASFLDLLAERDRLATALSLAQARIAELEKTLSRVIAEADRDTEAFKAAREAFRDRT